MRRFLTKVLLHIVLLIGILVLSLLFIPHARLGTPTYLYSILDKHRLLRDSGSPRLLFVGGSNLSFGLDSERISRECGTTVVNMGIHGGLGLRYMLNDLRPFIRERDVVLIAPEYDQFVHESGQADGDQELVNVLFDIYPDGRACVRPRQWMHLSRFLPTYAAKKLLLSVKRAGMLILGKRTRTDFGVYGRRAFNEHGDVVVHWRQPGEPFPTHVVKGTVDLDAVAFLNSFVDFLESKKARAFFLYPCFSSTSFGASQGFIQSLDRTLHDSLLFPILSTPDRYVFSDNLFFNTSYHLNKAGVDLRTGRVIEDLNRVGETTLGTSSDLDGLPRRD